MVEEVVEKPDGLNEITWARVLESRSAKIANEQDLKRRYSALTELIKVLLLIPKVRQYSTRF